ncbi:Pyocin activator protein PrtN [Halomonas sp. THAF5a]|uniref:pyocin activator PrtN family protein n=1 Tax=Halomonas sp. THAF5a TaxID=2587844 RepID=UPI0012683B56|nr:pyocin activator PrtN family protein [Halomonas sp. THAF5a]QFU01243.1 Pyocin activator protein PrtN [Halomonas sp. THAF5a]
MPRTEPPTAPPPWLDEAEPVSTVALLYREFGDVLIPLETVRLRYFRNRSAERFRRALRDGEIPLPIVTLDRSYKAQGFICLYQLAALLEHQAREAAAQREMMITTSKSDQQLRRRMIDAVPTTDFRAPTGTAD